MKPRLLHIVGAAAVLLATSGAALAYQSSASASVGPLGVQLIDMDTSDGVTPWIAFTPSTNGRDTMAFARIVPHFHNGEWQTEYGSSPWAPVSVALSSSRPGFSVWSNASVSGATDSFANGVTAAVSGYMESGRGPGRVFYNGLASGSGSFWLSANTQVVFSGDGAVSAMYSGRSAGASSRADLMVEGTGPDGTGRQSSSDRLETGSGSSSRSMEVSFLNLTGADIEGLFSTGAMMGGSITVPEPETYALLLAGLALVGFATRRRS